MAKYSVMIRCHSDNPYPIKYIFDDSVRLANRSAEFDQNLSGTGEEDED